MSAEGSRVRHALVGLLLFLLSAGYFASYARVGLYDDEGYLLEGVTRLLDGEILYRDIHHTYAPGRFFLFAGLFELLGRDLLVVRATWVVLRAAIVVMAWLLARRLLRGPLVWLPPLALLALPGPWHKSFFHFFLLATLLAGAHCLTRGGRGASFWTGVLVGVALLFRQDVGIAAAGAIGSYLVLTRLFPPSGEEEWPLSATAGPSPLLMIGGFVAALAGPVIYFARAHALEPLVTKLFLAGVRDNRSNALPFPDLLPALPPDAPGLGAQGAMVFVKLLYFVPPVTFAVFALVLLGRAVARRQFPAPAWFLLLLLGCAALLQAASRSDIPHLLQAIGLVYFPWAIGLAWLCGRLPGRIVPAAVAVVLALGVPAGLTLGVYALGRTVRTAEGVGYLVGAGVMIPPENGTGARVFLPGVARTRLTHPRARVDVTPAQAAVLDEAGAFLNERTRPGDYFLTLPGYQLLYFLFERRNPTAFPHVRRAFDSAAEESAYIAQIEERAPRYIFFQDFAIDGRQDRRFAVYARGVMEWIQENYRPVRTIGEPRTGLQFVVLERIRRER